ncbi:MAG: squalene--hopene cyclase, partial [Gaiellaceae bacterium]
MTQTAQRTAAQALERAVQHLLALQDDAGWWKGELETNVSMDAEDLLLREFLGIREEERTRRSANWIRSQQREDGTWANFYGGPGELSTTIEAYVALRIAGDSDEAEHMRRAAEWIRAHGGLEHARVFTRLWLSLVGLWSWDEVPVIPVECIFLPAWFPLNIYDYACWARQTIVALAVVSAHRPVRPVPFAIDELKSGLPLPRCRAFTWGWLFESLDAILHRYVRHPLVPLRKAALRKAERWIVERQEADGCWGGIQPPWVYSLIALHLQGRGFDDPVTAKGLAGLDGFTIVEGDTQRLEACQSPVWDTALALVALGDAGLPPDHPAVDKAARWMLGEEIRGKGDWAVRRPDLPPGGWAFEFENDWYPDVDDTAEVVLALRRAAAPGTDEAVARAIRWTLGMASKDGAWGAFDADNVRWLVRKLPFCDFGEVIDPPSADVTAHVVEMLAKEGMAGDPAVVGAVRWLLREQEPDGSWFGRWGANHVYGTGAVVPALVEAGLPQSHPSIRRAVAWLEQVQNTDGGWGEDMRSYDDPEWRGRGESTASQTAWALLALHAAGERGGVGSTEPPESGGAGFAGAGAGYSEAVSRGIEFLVATQTEDGTWD